MENEDFCLFSAIFSSKYHQYSIFDGSVVFHASKKSVYWMWMWIIFPLAQFSLVFSSICSNKAVDIEKERCEKNLIIEER